MSLRTVRDHPVAVDVDGLLDWLGRLGGPMPIETCLVLRCPTPGHEATPWYVEAHAAAAIARRRCVGCGWTGHTLDSAERWTFPPMWACPGCAQSMVELAAGLAPAPEGPERVRWVVLAARCVGCGRVSGLTDLLVDLPLVEALSRL